MRKDLDNSSLERIITSARRNVLNMIYEAGSGHPGGSLSCIDILTVLYFCIMNHNPENPLMPDRDRFILSKGHAAPALYAVLAESGYFSQEHLQSLRKKGSIFQGHPDRIVPGVEVSTGSLGQGLSIAGGLAIAAKIDGKSSRIFTLMGDGECDEGQVWEAAMFASHYKLDNLTAIIDRNGLQIDGLTEKIMRLEPLSKKWASFGWNVIETNGHDLNDLIAAFRLASEKKGKPSIIIAHTFKGRGISFMEWINAFHGRSLTREEMDIALKELEQDI